MRLYKPNRGDKKMTLLSNQSRVYKALHLFCGLGGGSLGFANAQEEYRGIKGRFENLAGIDVDPEACADYERITGSRSLNLDLFSREQYILFHGHEPDENWQEITPTRLRKLVGDCPDVVFTSPPCKGFSGLLSEKSAKTKKYQALNQLTVRSTYLTLEAFKDDLPGLFILENVPRITSRGKKLLEEIKQQLRMYGYVINDDKDQYHDCGEIGGLAQRRKRYLMIARHPEKLDSFVYQPPTYKVKNIGDVLETAPLPFDERYNKIHHLSNLQWKTWVRLALIPAGGDWRDLDKVEWEKYRIVSEHHSSVEEGVSLESNPSTGFKSGTHAAIYRMQNWEETSRTVTGAVGPNNGALCVNDPRLQHQKGRYSNKWQLLKWNGAATTVTGAGDIQSGAQSVADPRVPKETDRDISIIISEDGTWHRPLTTLELAVLQGFPLTMHDGTPFELAGNSDARWRERIGNAVPPAASQAIAETMLRTMLAQETGDWLMSADPIWVQPIRDKSTNENNGMYQIN